MVFKLTDTNRFDLKGTNGRFIHLATVHGGIREFMCFADRYEAKIYIEEIIGGQLVFITDDSLAQGLSNFLTHEGVLNLSQPIIPDKEWYKKP